MLIGQSAPAVGVRMQARLPWRHVGEACVAACIATLMLGDAALAGATSELETREILATGDRIERLGNIGVASFGVQAISNDSAGRVLFRAQSSGGVEALFQTDGANIETLWQPGAQAGPITRLGRVRIGPSGLIVAEGSRTDPTNLVDGLYSIAGGVAHPVVEIGDRTPDGDVICGLGRFAVGDGIAFSAYTAAPSAGCENASLWSEDVLAVVDGRLRTHWHSGVGRLRNFLVLGIAPSESVLVSPSDGTAVLALRGGSSRTVVSADMTSPTGAPYGRIDGVAANALGEVAFFARDGETNVLYRTDAGAIVRVVGFNDEIADAYRVQYFAENTVLLGRSGAVVVQAQLSRAGAQGVQQSTVFFPPADGARIIARSGAPLGINDLGAVAVQDAEGTGAVARWTGEQLERLVEFGAAAPTGGVFAVAGLWSAPCLASDGRVAMAVTSGAFESQGLVCVDATGPATVARSGDPAPEGGHFASIEACAFSDAALFFLGERDEPAYGNLRRALYRVSAAGLERLVGPGSMTADGQRVAELRSFAGTEYPEFTVNARGTVLLRALFDDRTTRVLRLRPGRSLEVVSLDLAPGPALSFFAIVGLTADDDAVIVGGFSSGASAMVLSDGRTARILTTPDDLVGGGAESYFTAHAVAGDRIVIGVSSLAGVSRLLAYTPDTGFTQLAEQPTYIVRTLTPGGRLFVEDHVSDQTLHLLLTGDDLQVLSTIDEQSDLYVQTINDRGNVLLQQYANTAGVQRSSLLLAGPPPDPGLRCFAPLGEPTASTSPAATATSTPIATTTPIPTTTTAPTSTAVPSATLVATSTPVATRAPSNDDDGCQTGPSGTATAWPLAWPAIVLLRRSRRANTRRTSLIALFAFAAITVGADRVAAQPSAEPRRTILATGDVVDGFGRIGFSYLTGFGIDGDGRVLASAGVSSGALGFFWLDGATPVEIWSRAADAPAESPRLGYAQTNETGRVIAIDWSRGDALYEVASGAATAVVRAGDRTDDGQVICRFGEFAVGDGETLAFTGFASPAGTPCDGGDWTQGVFVLERGAAAHRVTNLADHATGFQLLGIARDGTVAINLSTAGGMVLISPDGSRRQIFTDTLAPSGHPFGYVSGLDLSPSGEAVFFGNSAGTYGIYRTEGERLVTCVATGDVLSGATVGGLTEQASINARGDVITRIGLSDAGDTYRQALLLCTAQGDRILLGDAAPIGVNDAGAVAMQPVADAAPIVRWRNGTAQTLLTPGDPAPDGSRFLVGGIQTPYCLAGDGRAGATVLDATYRAALACIDANGTSAITRVGDPSPDGGEIYWFTQCAIAGGDQVLFAAPRYIREQQRSETPSVYRATADGIERVVGPGVQSNGIVVFDLGQWGVGAPGDAFVANDAGTVLAFAQTGDGKRWLRRRRGGPLERVRFALADQTRTVHALQWAGIGADDTVAGSATIDGPDGRALALIASDGAQARVLIAADDPRLPGAPIEQFDQLRVRGDHILTLAYGGSDQRIHALSVALADGSVRELPALSHDPALGSRYVLRDTSAAGRVLFDVEAQDGIFERFLLDGDGIDRLFAGATTAPDLPLAVNDRGNLLGATYDTVGELLRSTVSLSGPPPDASARCFIPPTAMPQPVATITPTPTPLDCVTSADPGCLRLLVGSASGRPGERVSIEVRLRTGAHDIAGIQADLHLIAAAPVAAADGGRPACRVNPAIDKNGTAFGFQPHACRPDECEAVRALVLALDNTDPIPDDSVLFTCDLAITADAAPGRYTIEVSDFLGSDPTGLAVVGGARAGTVEVLGGGEAPAAPGSIVKASGCQIGTTPAGAAAWHVLALLALAVRCLSSDRRSV